MKYDTLSEYASNLEQIYAFLGSLEADGCTQTEKTTQDTTEDIIRLPTPSIQVREDGSIARISVSQSLISKFYYKGEARDYCPMKLYHTKILKDVDDPPTESMEKGNFFETKCIGSSVYGKTESLPLGKKGQKSLDQQRIEEQVLNFKLVCEQYGIIINQTEQLGMPKNVQKHFSVPVEIDQFAQEGIKTVINLTADILSPISYGQVDYPVAIIDLKLTIDRNSKYGDYCWGAPEYMDHIQAYVYGFILGFPFFYLVFDYNAKDRGYKIIPVNTNLQHPNPEKREEAMRRYKETVEIIRNTIQRIIDHHHHGWYTNPNRNNCKNCPLVCADRDKNQEI